jgi:hypothetical protein
MPKRAARKGGRRTGASIKAGPKIGRVGKRRRIASRGVKTPVAMRSLIARINRTLAPQDMKLVRLKNLQGERVRQLVGDYHVIYTQLNSVMYHYKNWSPENLARDLGLLKPDEQVVEEPSRPPKRASRRR